jgi:RNA polymerase sigma-70 factor (ECF subfamily)
MPSDAPPDADDAFSSFVLPEIPVLLRVATSITSDPVDAEDLVQETLIRAYRAIDRFDGRHPRAWLFTIMRNAQRNRVRRRRPQLMRDPDLEMERHPPATDVADEPEGLVVDPVFDATVEAALDDLPAKFRSVVELVDLQALSYQEAADALGIPIGTVMSRLHRARKRIRDHLAAEGVTPYVTADPENLTMPREGGPS